MLGVAETQRLSVLAGERDRPAAAVECDRHYSLVADAGDLAAATVLDSGLTWRSVLADERNTIPITQPIMNRCQRDFLVVPVSPRVLASPSASIPSPDNEPADGDQETHDSADAPTTRAAPGITLEDYLAACDPVLGQRATEFALVLPAPPGIGATLDDAIGTLDRTPPPMIRSRTGASRRSPSNCASAPKASATVTDASWSALSLVPRSIRWWYAHSPHAAPCTRSRPTFGPRSAGPRCSPRHFVLSAPVAMSPTSTSAAAASLAAIGLGLLRTDVDRISRLDEHTMRYLQTGRAVASLLPDVSPEQTALLAGELSGHLSGAAGILAANEAIEEALHPLTGATRAAHLLGDEHNLAATITDGVIVELEDPIEGVAEARLILTLALAEDSGPVYVRGRNLDGQQVVAAWCAPWLAIERTGRAGPFGRAWKLAPGQTPAMLPWDNLPRATCSWFGGEPRPVMIADLLGLID